MRGIYICFSSMFTRPQIYRRNISKKYWNTENSHALYENMNIWNVWKVSFSFRNFFPILTHSDWLHCALNVISYRRSEPNFTLDLKSPVGCIRFWIAAPRLPISLKFIYSMILIEILKKIVITQHLSLNILNKARGVTWNGIEPKLKQLIENHRDLFRFRPKIKPKKCLHLYEFLFRFPFP